MDDYLLGRLSEEEAKAFEAYCFEHPEFLEEVRLREQLLKLIQEEGETLFAEDIQEKSSIGSSGTGGFFGTGIFSGKRARWIYAAAAIVIIAAFLIISYLPREDDVSRYARNFVQSEYLESLVGSNFRGEDISISVISPKNGENFKRNVRFEWNAQKNGVEFNGPFELVILNNNEEEVFRKEVENRQFVLQNKIDPGLYYWTLDFQEETLYLGKFFIRKPGK